MPSSREWRDSSFLNSSRRASRSGSRDACPLPANSNANCHAKCTCSREPSAECRLPQIRVTSHRPDSVLAGCRRPLAGDRHQASIAFLNHVFSATCLFESSESSRQATPRWPATRRPGPSQFDQASDAAIVIRVAHPADRRCDFRSEYIGPRTAAALSQWDRCAAWR
jgi:hypothetical protein